MERGRRAAPRRGGRRGARSLDTFAAEAETALRGAGACRGRGSCAGSCRAAGPVLGPAEAGRAGPGRGSCPGSCRAAGPAKARRAGPGRAAAGQ